MRNLKIVEKFSVDSPPKRYFIIVEILPNGLSFNWSGIYSLKEDAQKEIDNEK